ncbi:hypothetical protein GALMADRAFT_254253 [Galerina marginata CBS 339.88]|uniref:DUF3533 domain-containing protein n=1 Tax=Galerina marginata (strain CBS 339.88) TaxID=685588 RepID=A0A067SM22_GALM3|nr:hypothetical protein GALMADRAFT_254253 [Galerina marginata CBS 339.88]
MNNYLIGDSTTFNSKRHVSVSTDEASPTTTYNDDLHTHGSPLAATESTANTNANASPLSKYNDSSHGKSARKIAHTRSYHDHDHEHDAAPPHSPPPPPPEPYSNCYFKKGDPALKKARNLYLKIYFSGLFLVILTIFAVFPIYWGSLWKIPAHPLQGWIVDFDGGNVGQTIVRSLTSGTGRIIKWEIVPSARFPGGVVDVIREVEDNLAWVAVTINEGTSLRLEAASAVPDPGYNGSQAITAYGVEARNENAYRVFIRPYVQTSLDAIQFNFATQYATRLASSSGIANLLATSPQTVVSPVSYTIVNLIPFSQPVASAVVFVGLIYLLILSFFVVMIAYNARQVSGLNNLLNLRAIVTVRLLSSCVGYFFLSLFYSLLNLAFNLDLTKKYGHAGFMIFWMLNWIGMLAVGLALESLITLFTPQYIPFFMILWIIANVSVCVFPIQILPRIYHYGYAAPFYNISSSTRSIAFGTKNTLGLNFGVLFAWVLVSCLTLPAIQWFVRRRERRAGVARAAAAPPGPEPGLEAGFGSGVREKEGA